MLETLCLQSVSSNSVMICVKSFMDCLKKTLPEKTPGSSCDSKIDYLPKNMTKSKALAFLASRYEEVKSIGIAAEKGYWDFSHPAFTNLIAFLRQL